MPKTKPPNDSLPLVDLKKAVKHVKIQKSGEEVAEELLRKRIVEKSGKKCHCRGNIIKVKSWIIRPRHYDGLIGPGSRGECYRKLTLQDLAEQFTPLHCEDCGVQYFKLPNYQKSDAPILIV